jgi:MFS transporter, Spinster family, sphingosine-1-phosphate transporter
LSGIATMPESPRWPAATLAALTGLNLLNYLDRYVLPSVVTPLERELRLDDRHFALAATAFMLGYFLTSPFFGWLGDRLPRRPLVAAGVLVWSAATVLSGRAGSFGTLVLFRVLVGIGEASYGTLGPAWIADLFPAPRRGRAISLFYVAIPVGSAMGFLLGGVIAAPWGWRAAFLVAGTPGLALVPLVLRLPEPSRGGSERTAGAPTGVGFASLGRLRDYRLVVAGYVAQTFALGGFGTWAAAFLERTHHVPLAAADRFFGATLAATGLLATAAGGMLGAALERRRRGGYAFVLAASAALAAPTALVALAVPGAKASMVALAAAMFLLFLPVGPVNTLILECVPPGLRARAIAVSIFAIHLLGDLWSPGLVGLVSDLSGSLRTAVLLVLPAALALAAVFWGLLAFRRPAVPCPGP